MKVQREVFLKKLLLTAKNDSDIYLLSADMGAPTLDEWRKELPGQFLQMGISEQNAINFGAGLAKSGKKVYIYFMSCWAARCFEQLKYSVSMMNIPLTILGNGIGLGYTPAGPAHCPTEDISYLRSLINLEIYSPYDGESCEQLVDLTVNKPAFRFIRLERGYEKNFNEVNNNFNIEDGVRVVSSHSRLMRNWAYISSGFMLNRCIEAIKDRKELSLGWQIIDLFRIKPLNNELLLSYIKDSSQIITIEEQNRSSGGFGSAVTEFVMDMELDIPVKRLCLPDRYIFETGTRESLLDNNGLSIKDLQMI